LIALEFGAPELMASLWPLEECAIVLMPETAMDKDHGAISRQYQVGLAGELFVVKSKPKS
jgi:hypothetical protein